MSVRSHSMLLLAAATALSVSGCKQAPPPSESATPQPAAATAPQQIGGQDIVKLERKPTSGGQKPEFLAATVLPGRGMNVFQITANIPGKGEVDVFASPSLADAAAKLNGGPDDQNGNASFSFGGAFLVPYPNRIIGPVSSDGTTITTKWHGQTITDGQTLTGIIHAGDFGGHWLSQTDLSFAIALTGPAVDATITAKNVGK